MLRVLLPPQGESFTAQEAHDARVPQEAGAAEPSEARDDFGRPWLILGVVCLGQLMVVLDATVVNFALPAAWVPGTEHFAHERPGDPRPPRSTANGLLFFYELCA